MIPKSDKTAVGADLQEETKQEQSEIVGCRSVVQLGGLILGSFGDVIDPKKITEISSLSVK